MDVAFSNRTYFWPVISENPTFSSPILIKVFGCVQSVYQQVFILYLLL